MSQSSSSPLRWITPGQLGICVILFFLPWVEVQCQAPADLQNPAAKQNAKVWTPFIQQSGMQVASGGYTMPALFGANVQQQKAMAGGDDQEVGKAPLLWIYVVTIGVGIVIGLFAPSSGVKKVLLLLICLLALGVVGGQMAMGFPIEKAIQKEKENQEPKKKDDGARPKFNFDDVIKVVYKVPLYLTFVFLGGALLTGLLESPMRPRPRRESVPGDNPFDDVPPDEGGLDPPERGT